MQIVEAALVKSRTPLLAHRTREKWGTRPGISHPGRVKKFNELLLFVQNDLIVQEWI